MMQSIQSGAANLPGSNATTSSRGRISNRLPGTNQAHSPSQIPSRNPPATPSPPPPDTSDEVTVFSKEDLKVLQVKKLLDSLRREGNTSPGDSTESALKTLRELKQEIDAPPQPISTPSPSPPAQASINQVSHQTVVEVELREVSQTQIEGRIQATDPLVFDLDGDGVELTSIEDGVIFDIRGDGEPVQTSFVNPDDALLVLDRNGNGVVDDGRELFGDQNGAANGYEELAKYDDNRDGVIDAADAIYDRLRLFQDRNQDGKSTRNELYTLKTRGITSVGLSYLQLDEVYSQGNAIAQSARYTREDGRTGMTADVMLRHLNTKS